MCNFLGDYLISWFSKEQCSISLSTTEAEFVAACSCCTQILWMKHTSIDFGLAFDCVPLYCDNTSINLSKNPIKYSRTKYINVKYHFIRDLVLKGDISLDYIPTKDPVTDNFIKALPDDRFRFLRNKLRVLEKCCLRFFKKISRFSRSRC